MSDTRNTLGQEIGQGGSTGLSGSPEIFSQYPIASWTVGGTTLAFPAKVINDTGGNRIIQRERPFRDGAKLDDTGSRAKVWAFEVLFENSIEEEGLEVNGVPLYPDVANALIESFDTHETGDLVIPTVGKRRARAESYSRVEDAEVRDASRITLTFVEDNEDNVDFRSVQAPTVNANARRLAEQTTFDAQSIDNWDQTFADLETAVNALEDLANSPFETAAEIEQRAQQVADLVQNAEQKFARTGKRGRDTFRGPGGNKAKRKLSQQREIAARATNDARRGRPSIISVQVGVDTNLFAVAAFVNQSFTDLVAINPQLETVLVIRRGTVVKVFANTGKVA